MYRRGDSANYLKMLQDKRKILDVQKNQIIQMKTVLKDCYDWAGCVESLCDDDGYKQSCHIIKDKIKKYIQ